MRVVGLTVRGFRNLADADRAAPARGACLLGANGQGKTNLLEAVCYPVLFRSFRGALDAELPQFGGPGFHVGVVADTGGGTRDLRVTYHVQGRRKAVTVDGEPQERLAAAVGRLLAVAFLPADVALASAGAAPRRQYLDRMLSLADPAYLAALWRYRAALAQRNGGLRAHRPDVARAFEPALAAAGARVVAARVAWAAMAVERFAAELDAIGEPAAVGFRYVGREDLADAAAWPEALAAAQRGDVARGATSVGPHRDDLALLLDGRPLRDYGSTGQQRSAAIALRLLELDTLAAARGTEPLLLLDDVFAELDRDRQARLAARVLAAEGRQLWVTAPRKDELPDTLDLPVWTVREGRLA